MRAQRENPAQPRVLPRDGATEGQASRRCSGGRGVHRPEAGDIKIVYIMKAKILHNASF